MDVVNVYGHLCDNMDVVIGVGNYNNIHGLACYYPNEDLLQIRSMPEIMTPSVIQLILRYEKLTNTLSTDKVYFSLEVKNNDSTAPARYINVNIDVDGDQKVACAIISSEKAFFTIYYSTVDKTPRSELLAGALYSLQTTFGEQNYIVSWKINGFTNGDLVIFLPTAWYETIDVSEAHIGKLNTDYPIVGSPRALDGDCQMRTGINNLIDSLNQLKFKGYTTQQWCESASHVVNCHDNNLCGDCFGPCQDPNNICWPEGDKFICGPPQNEPNMIQLSMVSFADTPSTPQTTGTAATWIAIVAIFLIVAILAWGLTHKYYNTL